MELEILRLAKDLVVNEYIDRRADLHNKWLAESDYMWRTKKIKLAYPPIPPYPTENEILARAQMLMEFVKAKEAEREAEKKTKMEAKLVAANTVPPVVPKPNTPSAPPKPTATVPTPSVPAARPVMVRPKVEVKESFFAKLMKKLKEFFK